MSNHMQKKSGAEKKAAEEDGGCLVKNGKN
jgi:hypothetical protein